MSGSVSCMCETTGAGTSNASTTTMTPCESGCFVPATSILIVCVPLGRPLTLKTRDWLSSLLANSSTVCTSAPSISTRAWPLSTLRMPIHVTDVPVKVKVALAPGIEDCTAVPPLHTNQSSALRLTQPVLKVTEGSDSSKCRPPVVGVGEGGGGEAALLTVTVTGC